MCTEQMNLLLLSLIFIADILPEECAYTPSQERWYNSNIPDYKIYTQEWPPGFYEDDEWHELSTQA